MEGPSGPLDYAGNDMRTKDAYHHKLGKISDKISDNMYQLQNKQRTLETLNNDIHTKEAAATTNNFNPGANNNSMYGNSLNMRNSAKSATYQSNFYNPKMTNNKNESQMVNELYNKRANQHNT